MRMGVVITSNVEATIKEFSLLASVPVSSRFE
jgi:hypothetical protein